MPHEPLVITDETRQTVLETICPECSDAVTEHWDNEDGTVVLGLGVPWSDCPRYASATRYTEVTVSVTSGTPLDPMFGRA